RRRDSVEEVYHLMRLGKFATWVGDIDHGFAWLQDALNTLSPGMANHSFFRSQICVALSKVMQQRGDNDDAVRYAEVAVGAAKEIGGYTYIADAQLMLAAAEQARGEWVEALRLADEVLSHAQREGWKHYEMEAGYLRGELLREMGWLELAEAAAQRAL